MSIQIYQFACLKDNFGVLVHDSSSGATAAIDAPDGQAVLDALALKGWTLTDILVTHRHGDHVDGIPALKARFPKVQVVAPAKEASQIGGVDRQVGEGDIVAIGSLSAKVIETPGHTAGHVAYWFEEQDLLFAGDTLFAMGCGRVFETPMSVMWHSLMKLAQLPGETQLYCGHEYTVANGAFAITVDPDNALLRSRLAEAEALRARGQPTLPSTITLELATNPFLRAEEPNVQRAVGMAGADPAAVFAELRDRKNKA
jgi:hydroxyacylglutathione hydrolase